MKTRRLGKNGRTISEVGLGCWQFGGDFGDMKEETAFSIMGAAVENEITFFDTANVYGAGRSETLIGEFIKTCSTPITVVTKFGRGEGTYPDNYAMGILRQSVEDSLERLGMDSLDLLQLHCVPTEVLRQGEIFDWLRQIKQEGLIKEFGASVETVEEGMICMEQDGLLSLQIIFNIFRQKPAKKLLPAAKEKGVGIIVRLPLASGLLSGKFTQTTTFSDTDHRNYNRDGQFFNVGETFAGLPFETGVSLADQIKQNLPQGMSMVEMALRWILDHDAVSVIIPGASSPEQVIKNAAASGIHTLPEELHQVLADIYEKEIHSRIRGPY